MPYDINASLERLEQSLQNINSAREQVEQTVTSSNELKNIVAEYVASLNAIKDEVKELEGAISEYQNYSKETLDTAVSGINSNCDVIITNFNNQTKAATKSFESSMSASLDSFAEKNADLASHIKKMSKFESALKAMDVKLQKIDGGQTATAAKTDSIFNWVSNVLEMQIPDILSKLDALNKQLNDTHQQICDLSESLTSIHGEAEALKNLVNNNAADLKKSVFNKCDEVLSKANVILIVEIIGFIVSFVMVLSVM